jgi:light-regulated signal transduction histidine kinase (bacteriophytochrome)
VVKTLQINLSDCEKEQIHTPELIQPHGYAIVFDKENLSITRYSENIFGLFNDSNFHFLGKRITELFPEKIVKEILNNFNSKKLKRFNFLNESIEPQSHDSGLPFARGKARRSWDGLSFASGSNRGGRW